MAEHLPEEMGLYAGRLPREQLFGCLEIHCQWEARVTFARCCKGGSRSIGRTTGKFVTGAGRVALTSRKPLQQVKELTTGASSQSCPHS